MFDGAVFHFFFLKMAHEEIGILGEPSLCPELCPLLGGTEVAEREVAVGENEVDDLYDMLQL